MISRDHRDYYFRRLVTRFPQAKRLFVGKRRDHQDYSLRSRERVSHRYRCIFVHVPKCAGSSVKMFLYGNQKGGDHATAMELKYLFPDEYENYYKFAVIRMSEEPHSTYIKVKKKRASSLVLIVRLLRLMFKRSSRGKFLSINDSGELDNSWLTEAAIALFFRVTYPGKSRFERRGKRRANTGSPRLVPGEDEA